MIVLCWIRKNFAGNRRSDLSKNETVLPLTGKNDDEKIPIDCVSDFFELLPLRGGERD